MRSRIPKVKKKTTPSPFRRTKQGVVIYTPKKSTPNKIRPIKD